MMKGHLEGMLS